MNRNLRAAYARGQISILLVVQTIAIGALYVLFGDHWYIAIPSFFALAVTMRAFAKNDLDQLEAEYSE